MPDKNTYDVIIVGSGISGGWAAKELCEKGLKVLVLERGRNVEHIKDYPTATTPPWEFQHHRAIVPHDAHRRTHPKSRHRSFLGVNPHQRLLAKRIAYSSILT